MNDFASLIRIIISVLPFVVMSLASSKINLEPKYRGHQFIMPFVAIVYCLLIMLGINQIATGLIRLIRTLSNIIRFIPIVGNLISGFFDNIYSSLNMGYGVQLLCNTVVMTAFCGIKRVCLPIMQKWWSKWRTLYNATSGHFYTELGEKSILLQEFAHMRILFNVLYYVAVALGAVDCILAILFNKSDAFLFPFYPVFGIIVLGEISFFLNGQTFDEQRKDNEDEPEEVGEDYVSLMESLKKTFGDRVLLSNEVPKSMIRSAVHDWKTELEDGDSIDLVTGAYFSSMQLAGEYINPDYVQATSKLMHHKSVLIYNPFYHDLTQYLLLPVFHELLNNHTCLIVCGRMTNEEDIEKWIREGIEETTNLPKLWKISELDEGTIGTQMPDIGILGFRRLFDLENLKLNKEFFKKVTFIILLEPSNLLGTGQIGLRSILQYCEDGNKELTYCALDRNSDGLVDALSHAVRQSITEVIASPAPENPYCRMFWQAEGNGMHTRILPRISHYLGMGGEIASYAMHKGIDNIHWYSGSKMPLTDLKWNIEQYYPTICQYIYSPKEQAELNARFQFHENMWQANYTTDSFVLVEDEFCNVFEMARTFAARIHRKGFVNILSENYMLRDYMCGNEQLFSNDPKAIPSIVPDYAQTERNFVLRTIMLMAFGSIDEKYLSQELSLHGCETCYPYRKLCELITKHTGIEEPRIQTIREDVWVGGKILSRFSYTVDKQFVETAFDSALKSAYYVVENEQVDKYLMGNRLMGHIEQTILPGQFFCYDGKYYQVRSISKENGIIVRRASDHLTGRIYYRQLRDYSMNIIEFLDNAKYLRGIKLQSAYAYFDVVTDGYIELKSANMLPDASLIRLEEKRKRNIKHKEILQIEFSGADAKVRFTLCVLLNELFKTLYPNENGYLIASMNDIPETISNHPDYLNKIRSVVPTLNVENGIEEGIYFVEDSAIDLGLLVSVERNFQRIMEILADYLDWYLDENRLHEDEEDTVQDNSMDDAEDESETASAEDAASDVDGEGDVDYVDGEDEELNDGPNKSDWKEHVEYLTFGYKETPEWLVLEETLEYLISHKFDDSNLHRSRKVTSTFDDGSNYDPNQPGTHYCDFCGSILEDGKYDVLKDGRERCPACSADAIKTRKQFKQVYSETLKEMQEIFDIQFDYEIKVRMKNAREVNEPFGEKSYKPSPRFDSRVLGYAQDGNSIYVENGAPKWKMKSTLVHELTHIWQHHNWEESFLSKYGEDETCSQTMEGMAVWTEIQYLLSMGEKDRAIRYKKNRDGDSSVYGVGMKKFIEKYPVKETKKVSKNKSPFGKFPKI